jgi:hypothetical protein
MGGLTTWIGGAEVAIPVEQELIYLNNPNVLVSGRVRVSIQGPLSLLLVPYQCLIIGFDIF